MKYLLCLLLIPSAAFADNIQDLIKALQAQQGAKSPFVEDSDPIGNLSPYAAPSAPKQALPQNYNITIQSPPLLLREQVISERVGAPTGNVLQDGLARGLHGALYDAQVKRGR